MAATAVLLPIPITPGMALDAISDEIDLHNQTKYSPTATSTKRTEVLETVESPPDSKSTFRLYPLLNSPLLAFYTTQHTRQTLSYNLAARSRFHCPSRARPAHTIWDALLLLSTLTDASDPDAASLSQLQHALQTAEALRRDAKPRWMQLVGLVHDLGKMMAFVPGMTSGDGGGQWDVVGDTFPVGCAFSERIVYPGTFSLNPDATHPVYSTPLGIYERGCGIEGLVMSWGHDEYLYQVLRDQSTLPREGLAMVRYHSFYAWHREGAYMEFMREGDEGLLDAVREFNPYDLYTKRDGEVEVEEVRGYWEGVIGEFVTGVEGDGVVRW